MREEVWEDAMKRVRLVTPTRAFPEGGRRIRERTSPFR